MRLGRIGVPLIILSHRKQEFIEQCIESIRDNATGITNVIVVDDSGDPEHHEWLDSHGYQYSAVHLWENRGYYEAMQRVWEVAVHEADKARTEHVMLWEEDFLLTRPLNVLDMRDIMLDRPALAQLNLQRQAVYRVERRFGYMESHRRRGYGLDDMGDYVIRERPFTTNPGLINREVLDVEWPSREECNNISGGAEPAMSLKLESDHWYFGWYGKWNTPHTKHIGTALKTGKGY